jgi:citrate synthase
MLPPSDGMDALRTLTSALGHYDPDAHDNSLQASYRKPCASPGRSPASSPRGAACRRAADRSRRIRRWDTPQLPLHAVRPPSEPDRDSRDGHRADAACDHELNASTFAARVAAATLTDIPLRDRRRHRHAEGPLHGGAKPK